MLLGERGKRFISQKFSSLKNPVRILMFTQETECEFCADTRELVEQVAQASPLVTAEIRNFILDRDAAAQYRVDKIPAIAIIGEVDYGVRYYGIPAGYEFGSFIEDIVDVSNGDSGLSPDSRRLLASLDQDVHLQVFTTPTWPYCPQAVRLAHKAAIESPRVTADAVEAMEFPHLVMRYQVRGVPRTVINDQHFVDGALPEGQFISAILQAVAQSRAPKS